MRYLFLSLVLVLQVNNAAGYNVPILPKTCIQNTLTSENSDSNACSQTLDHFNLINMGGRMYDPVVAQFLSPDPYVQMPENPLSYNHYSYCLNSPLKYVDRTGYFFDEWNFNINTGEMTWVSDYGRAWNRHYVNIMDDENFYMQYAFPAQYFSYNWNKDIYGNVDISIRGFSSDGSRASYFQQFYAGDAIYIDGMRMSSNEYTAGIPSYDFYKPPASGRADFSPINVGDFIGMGMAVKGLVSAAASAIGRVMGMNVARTVTQVAAETGTYSVYYGWDAAGITRYVGITSRAPAVRFGEHLSSGTLKSTLQYDIIKGAEGLTKKQARIWEQNLINQLGMQKNGGLLFNQRNSIAPKFWWQYGIKP